jgi:polyisoprenoid-binding protein YceI
LSTIAADAITGTWKADKVHSTVGFSVKYMGVQTFRGRFEDFDASLEASEDGVLELTGRVAADSIVVKDENLAAHLKSPEFFDVERHPTIGFRSTLVRIEGDRLVVDGELTINGQTKAVEGSGTISGPSDTPFGTTVLGVEVETIVDRTEFGLRWNAPLPKGGFVLANDVKLAVNLERRCGS